MPTVDKQKSEPGRVGWKPVLVLTTVTAAFVFANFYIWAVGGSRYLSNLIESLGGAGVLMGFGLVGTLALIGLPLFSGVKAKAGHPVLWCLLWNVGLFVVTLGFGPVGAWFKLDGATPSALVLGQENWLVKTVLHEQFGWGMGPGAVPRTPGSEVFVSRWEEIADQVKTASSLEQLEPYVCSANLQTVSQWPKKKQLLGLQYVRTKLSLLEYDAQKEKRSWAVFGLDQRDGVVLMQWRAYKQSSTDYLSYQSKLVQEDGMWKADFSSEIHKFNQLMQERQAVK